MVLSGFFSSYAGMYVTQAVWHSLTAALLVKIAIRT
jgi:hypothetical protein